MTKLKIFFFGLSALIILSFFGYKYWQTQPSDSLLQIQESIESKNPDLFYKHVNVEKILAKFYEDLYELFEEYFLPWKIEQKIKWYLKELKKKTTDKPITFVSIKYSSQTILMFPGLLLIQTAE